MKRHEEAASFGYAGLILLPMLFLLLVSCSEPAPYRIGFLGGLTGETAALGLAGRDGVILAVEEVNRRGGIAGRMVDLIISDDEQDPETARRALTDMAAAGVVGIVGPMTGPMALAIHPVAAATRTPVVSPTVGADELTGRDDFFFRVCPADGDTAANLAALAFSSRGYRRIAVLYDLSRREYTEPLARRFSTSFEARGGSVVQAVSYTTRDDTDFALLAAQLLEATPDSVCILARAGDAAKLCQQLVRQARDIPVLVSEWSVTPEFLSVGGGAVEGVEFFHSVDRNSMAPAYLAFVDQYRARYHRDPDPASIHSYEAAMILLSAVEQGGVAANLRETIVSTARFPGLQSVISFDRFGDVQRPAVLKTIRNGIVTTVSTVGGVGPQPR